MKLNPLNVIGERETSFVPKHFTVVPVPSEPETYHSTNDQHVRWWIYQNLDGRFGFQSKQAEGFYGTTVQVGFEDPSEATYFSMAYSNKNQFEDF